MGVDILHSVKFLPNVFQNKFLIGIEEDKTRTRKFTAHRFFLTVIQLVAGCNGEGAWTALIRSLYVAEGTAMPGPSAFCAFRQKISYLFFKDCFEKLINKAEDQCVATFGGLRIFAIDGQQWMLPRTKDIVAQGFNGRQIGPYQETYMPRGYLVHLYDVVTGISKAFTFNKTLNEHADAKALLRYIDKKSLVIYDRLFFSYSLMNQHFKAGNYFLTRCKRKANNAVTKLYESNNLTKYSFSNEVDGRVHLFKIRNPRRRAGESQWLVFATNLPASWHDAELLADLYMARWEVETSFNELTGITRGEQWHSKKFNGIMQELYAKFWLVNFTKISMILAGQKPRHPVHRTYRKANFKAIFNYIADILPTIWFKLQEVVAQIRPLLRRTTQKRKRCSRTYKRELKRPRSPYPHKETGWFWNLK